MEKLLTTTIMAVLMTGCANLPEPTSQVRLSDLEGAVETPTVLPFVDAAVSGTSCVLSTVGDLPRYVSVAMTKGDCSISIESEPGQPFIHTHNAELEKEDD